MLPLGWLRGKWCQLSVDEQVSLLSLWMIFRSPLIHGGDLTKPDNYSLSLLTNSEALGINSNSVHNQPVLSNSTLAIWLADSDQREQDGISYFTVHNLDSQTLTISLTTNEIRLATAAGSKCLLRDIWQQKDVQSSSSYTFTLRSHQSQLLSLRQCSTSSVTSAQSSSKKQRHRRTQLE